jgi:hypothetical protein
MSAACNPALGGIRISARWCRSLRTTSRAACLFRRTRCLQQFLSQMRESEIRLWVVYAEASISDINSVEGTLPSVDYTLITGECLKRDFHIIEVGRHTARNNLCVD